MLWRWDHLVICLSKVVCLFSVPCSTDCEMQLREYWSRITCKHHLDRPKTQMVGNRHMESSGIHTRKNNGINIYLLVTPQEGPTVFLPSVCRPANIHESSSGRFCPNPLFFRKILKLPLRLFSKISPNFSEIFGQKTSLKYTTEMKFIYFSIEWKLKWLHDAPLRAWLQQREETTNIFGRIEKVILISMMQVTIH